MHPPPIFAFLRLIALAAAQDVTNSTNMLPAITQRPSDVDLDETTTMTLPGSLGGGIVYECEVKGKSDDDEIWYGYDCESISDVTLSTSAVGRRNSAQLVDPVGVLEARMGRKFGIDARQTDARSRMSTVAAITPNASCMACNTVTVTSTTFIERVNSSCLPSPTKFPHDFSIPTIVPVSAAQVTAMSIVANILSQEMAAAAQPTSTPDIISAILNVLTANVSTMINSISAPISNTTILSATLASATPQTTLNPLPSQAKSGGTSIVVGVLTNVIAAAVVAYFLA